MRRGEIYIIRRRDTIGAEITKARPAVIVSNDSLSASNGTVSVVYLTTQPKREIPAHVCLQSSGLPSVALCEQIDSVSTKLVGACIGACTEEEMAAIDRALLWSLGMADVREAPELSKAEQWLTEQLSAATLERDRYAKMVDLLLGGKV